MVILCHSSVRCAEYEAFLEDLLTFLKDVVDVVDLFDGDKVEIAHKLKSSLVVPAGGDLKAVAKSMCKVLLSTPTQFLELLNKKAIPTTLKCNSLVVDKVDMHLALDLSAELLKIAEHFKEEKKATFRTIITTQFKGAAEDNETLIKKAFMGDKKALII